MLCYCVFTHKSFKSTLSVSAVVYLVIVGVVFVVAATVIVVVAATVIVVVVVDVIVAASAVAVVLDQRLYASGGLVLSAFLMLRKCVRCRQKNVVFLHL